ncbi:MAG: FAD-binding protein, partial [Deltaproteobacteria bacterium]|nr:FAD-binding protein [Deltaproteobacteria bacterium]
MADAGSAQQEADALVVGAGLAGAVAALRLREAGLAVRVVADGGGATELSTGALGLVPRLAPDDLRWLLHVLPGAFTAREDGAPMRVATAAGRIVDVAAAPIQTLDLRSVPEGRIAVVGADLSGAPDLDGLVKLLETAGGGTSRFVAVRVPLLPHDELALLSPGSAAGRLAAEP